MNWFLYVCIQLFALLVANVSAQGVVGGLVDEVEEVVDEVEDGLDGFGYRNRHRHRHRHRHRLHQQHLVDTGLLKIDFPNVEGIMQAFEEDLNTLTDGLTIREDVVEMAKKNVTFPRSQDFAEILGSQLHLLADIPVNSNVLKNLQIKVLDSITRTLSFYGAQLDEITKDDTSLSLKILKVIDDKHGKVLQNKFPLDQWIQRNCDTGKVSDSREENLCKSMVRQWKNRSGGKANMAYWKPASVLQNYLNQVDDKTLENIGDEKEGLWGILNGECQAAVVSRCEIPYICERTLLDPIPRSQYLLTHQLFQRLLIDNSDCHNLRSFVTDEDTYTKLCTKAYMETQYLDLLDVPLNQRDLFAELVGFCGYLGYTNFLRVDWLDRMLSWQSKSDSGCFVEDPLSPIGLLTTDMGFKRRATKKELEQGVEQLNEKCLPHLTAVTLTALTAYWDYLMDLKSLRVGDRSEF